MKHYRTPVGNQHQDSPTGGRDRGQDGEEDRRRGDEKQDERPHNAMTFINMTQAGNDAEQNRHGITRFRLGRFRCLKRPIAVRARSRIFGQRGAAIWALLRVPAHFLGLGRCVGVFHQD